MIPSVTILGVPVSAVTMQEAVRAIDCMLVDGNQHMVVTPNPEMIVAARRDSNFKEILRRADLAIPDGIGLLWASHYLAKPRKYPVCYGIFSLLAFPLIPTHHSPLTRRVSGIDLVMELASRHADAPVKWFLLGAREGVAHAAQEKLTKRFPHLSIVGTYAGSPQDATVLERINAAEPDILFVAFGHGKQEKWIAANLTKLPSVKVAIGIGGTLDFIAGEVRRAPHWMRSMGLEWLWRLLREPRRFKRIWTATVTFPRLVIKKQSDLFIVRTNS